MTTTDLYVSTIGSDSNSGTQTSPFKTILAASQAAQPGTTVHVAAGTYYGGFATTASGTSSALIHYVSDTPGGATIVPAPSSTSEFGWDQRGAYVTIDGFNVDGANYQGGKPWTVGINLDGSHSLVENSHVHNIMTNASQVAANGSHGGAGIMLEGYYGGTNMNAIGNVVDHIGPSDWTASGAQYIQGIYASSGHDTIANNQVYLVSCDAISNYHDATNNVIVNNTIFNSHEGIDIAAGGTYHLTSVPDNFFVANNIVYNTTNGIEEASGVGTHDTVTNNLVYGNGSYNYQLAHATAQNSVNAAPQFVNYGASGGGDYHLAAGSAAIDSGTATDAPSTDLAGTARPQGAGVDIGAYEYISSGGTSSGGTTSGGTTSGGAATVQPFDLPVSGASTTVIDGDKHPDTLTGTSGNDYIDGVLNVGNTGDTMTGAAGDNTYVVNNNHDQVVENTGQGIDTVLLKATSYTLAANVENLTSLGSVAHNIVGNQLDNLITAGGGNDTINGGAGNDIIKAGGGADVLTGGTGHDMFAFSAVGAGSKVTDFHPGEDLLDLRLLMKAIGYTGTDPVADHTMALVPDGAGGTEVTVDPTHSGTMHNLVDVQHVAGANLHVGTDLLWH
jgi:Ca2+-binding RTX toxin-like protein